jgi:microcystin-dependent protein
MSTPFLSEIKIISWNYAPKGWAFCNGQTLPINQNQALFALLGTTYGGNGQSTFQLPNLQGRVPIMESGNFPLGAVGGESSHTLITSEIPAHGHSPNAVNSAPTTNSPAGATLCQPSTVVGNLYGPATGATTLAPQAIANAGGSQPHSNQQPYLVVNYIIALQGIFPSRN